MFIIRMTSLCPSRSFFEACAHPRVHHSFPTRRSSDLVVPTDRAEIELERARPEVVVGELREKTSSRARSSSRSEEHTSELQSHVNLVCRALLAKKKRDSGASGSHARDRAHQPRRATPL